MSTSPYETKNAENFDATTFRLREALKQIENDLSLTVKATTLAKLANVHRNTIYQREWPREELNRIKAAREQQIKERSIEKTKTKSPEELLEQSRLEILYWFTQLEEARISVKSLTATSQQTARSRDYYIEKANKSQEIISELRADILKLQSAMAILEDELTKTKALADNTENAPASSES